MSQSSSASRSTVLMGAPVKSRSSGRRAARGRRAAPQGSAAQPPSPGLEGEVPQRDVTLAALIGEDFRANGRSRVSPGFHALVVYRFGRCVYRDGRARLRWARPLYRLGRAFVAGVYSVELPREAQIGRRLHLPHPHGVVVSSDAVIGDDCMLRHNVTIGAGSDTRGGYPTIGDRVQFGPGSIVMGAVHVGDDVMIGPGAVVVRDVPAGSRVLAPLATCRPPRAATAGPPSDSDLPSLDERADR